MMFFCFKNSESSLNFALILQISDIEKSAYDAEHNVQSYNMVEIQYGDQNRGIINNGIFF